MSAPRTAGAVAVPMFQSMHGQLATRNVRSVLPVRRLFSMDGHAESVRWPVFDRIHFMHMCIARCGHTCDRQSCGIHCDSCSSAPVKLPSQPTRKQDQTRSLTRPRTPRTCWRRGCARRRRSRRQAVSQGPSPGPADAWPPPAGGSGTDIATILPRHRPISLVAQNPCL